MKRFFLLLSIIILSCNMALSSSNNNSDEEVPENKGVLGGIIREFKRRLFSDDPAKDVDVNNQSKEIQEAWKRLHEN